MISGLTSSPNTTEFQLIAEAQRLGLDTKRSEDERVYVYAPKNVRDYKLLPNPGETPEETKLAELAWKAILDNDGL